MYDEDDYYYDDDDDDGDMEGSFADRADDESEDEVDDLGKISFWFIFLVIN